MVANYFELSNAETLYECSNLAKNSPFPSLRCTRLNNNEVPEITHDPRSAPGGVKKRPVRKMSRTLKPCHATLHKILTFRIFLSRHATERWVRYIDSVLR